MSYCIYKYPFMIQDNFTIKMPKFAEILNIQDQDGIACIWVKADPSEPLETRYFHVAGTGHLLPQKQLIYHGTIQRRRGTLVWHIFETYF